MICGIEHKDTKSHEFDVVIAPVSAVDKETFLVLKPVPLRKGFDNSLYLLGLLRKPNLLKNSAHCHVHDQVLERKEREKRIICPI